MERPMDTDAPSLLRTVTHEEAPAGVAVRAPVAPAPQPQLGPEGMGKDRESDAEVGE